jgi:hypothetical protein
MSSTPTVVKLIQAIVQNPYHTIVDIDGTKFEIVPIQIGSDGIGRPVQSTYEGVKEAYCDANNSEPKDSLKGKEKE